MKKILIVGDSLAGGMPHMSYPSLLRTRLPDYSITASALGGDTIHGIGKRIGSLLPEHDPDILVVEGGSNDILLPILEARGGNWRRLARRFERSGSVPASDAEDFHATYAEILAGSRGEGVTVIATTLACIGENMGTEANRLREDYNRIVRDVAGEYGAVVADAGRAFEAVLVGLKQPGSYFLDHFTGAFLDTLRCLTRLRTYRLSGKRGLTLTIDGVHANPLGAEILANTVFEAIAVAEEV